MKLSENTLLVDYIESISPHPVSLYSRYWDGDMSKNDNNLSIFFPVPPESGEQAPNSSLDTIMGEEVSNIKQKIEKFCELENIPITTFRGFDQGKEDEKSGEWIDGLELVVMPKIDDKFKLFETESLTETDGTCEISDVKNVLKEFDREFGFEIDTINFTTICIIFERLPTDQEFPRVLEMIYSIDPGLFNECDVKHENGKISFIRQTGMEKMMRRNRELELNWS